MKRKVAFEYPGGFCETAPSVSDAIAKLNRASHTGAIRECTDHTTTEKKISFEEYRATGPDGKGWYFAGRIYL